MFHLQLLAMSVLISPIAVILQTQNVGTMVAETIVYV